MTPEHYPGMTEKALEAIVAEARQRWDIYEAPVIHRVGPLKPLRPDRPGGGDQCPPGRSLAACEFIMDYLKTRAPFWKREATPEGHAGWMRGIRTIPPRHAGRRLPASGRLRADRQLAAVPRGAARGDGRWRYFQFASQQPGDDAFGAEDDQQMFLVRRIGSDDDDSARTLPPASMAGSAWRREMAIREFLPRPSTKMPRWLPPPIAGR